MTPDPYPPRRWPTFAYGGGTYSFDHLDEYVFTVVDTDKIERRIAVSFSDHCFTRSPEPGDDPALAYPLSDRRPGHFSVDRYERSRSLRAHIASSVSGKVWVVQGGNFAVIPTVDSAGVPTYYGIMFSLDRVKGLPVDLQMRVRSAFPYGDDRPVTYGHVRFRHLVTLRMKGKVPGRLAGSRWPPPR